MEDIRIDQITGKRFTFFKDPDNLPLEIYNLKQCLKVIAVNPNGTSQICSNCSHKVKKSLSVRMHNCPVCHTHICRDLNAAINIRNRGAHDLFKKAQFMSSKTSR